MENTQQGNLSKKLTSSTISKNENVQLPSISRWFKIKKPPGTLIPSGKHTSASYYSQQYALASYIVSCVVAPCNRCYFYTQK
nr:MAG TPA: hypothetical protein [Siphoviridae sp. ctV7v5]